MSLDAQCEQVITKYTEWLNLWHEAEGDKMLTAESQFKLTEHLRLFNNPPAEGVLEYMPFRVTREMYDELGAADSPEVLIDREFGMGLHDTRIIHMRLTPYHDEGGFAELTAYFDNYNSGSEEEYNDSWELRTIVHTFDTNRQVLWNQDPSTGTYGFQSTPESGDGEKTAAEAAREFVEHYGMSGDAFRALLEDEDKKRKIGYLEDLKRWGKKG